MKKLKLVSDPFPPYQYHKCDGEVVGADYDIVKTAFSLNGIEIDVELFPWIECEKKLARNEAEGAFQVQKSKKREAEFIFSDTLRNAETCLYTSKKFCKKFLHEYKSYEDINIPIGVITGYNYGDAICPSVIDRAEKMDDSLSLVKAVNDGSIEACVLDCGVHSFITQDDFEIKLYKIDQFSFFRPLCLILTKENEGLVSSFNQGLCEIRENGVYQSILDGYKV